MTIIEQARAIRAAMDGAANVLTDEQALEAVELYPLWETGKAYVKDERIRYSGQLYKCLQAHTAQSNWTPDAVASLWAKLTLQGEYRVIPDVITSTEAFAKGERGWWKGVLYESLIAANTWTPAAYPAGWKVVT